MKAVSSARSFVKKNRILCSVYLNMTAFPHSLPGPPVFFSSIHCEDTVELLWVELPKVVWEGQGVPGCRTTVYLDEFPKQS